ncbi:hypothetical protein [Litchfieldia salsa]|uniref:Uncharacterized protein n=1 Tax=Litchfieldia salsa TaxID=930152 RepID=A0A1H0U7M3_9BACI|nr:hypothetical protein [Litchfieldia salsa]SDP62060.1 hypothetical protein SAMN05216565_104200 [Litchfieldia salsa]
MSDTRSGMMGAGRLPGIPFYDINEPDLNQGLSGDHYEIMLNNHYIGNKKLLYENDSMADVDDFLKLQGYTEFKSELEGDHYHIQTSKQHEADIKNALTVYLNNR